MATEIIIKNLRSVLDSRKKTVLVLRNIYKECQKAGKKYNTANIFTRVLSTAAGTASVGLAIATPFTAGLTGAPAVVLAGVSAASSAASLGTSFAQTISENGLMKQVHAALEEDRRASARLENALRAILEIQSLALDTTKFAASLAKLGIHTLNKSADILKASGKSMKIVDSVTDAAQLFGKAGKALTTVSKVVSAVSIPVDIMLLIVDLKDCANENYSEAAAKIKNAIEELMQMIAVMQDFLAELEG